MNRMSKDSWIGFTMGIASVLILRPDIPDDVKKVLQKALDDFKEWEAQDRGKEK